MVAARGWGGGKGETGESVFNGYAASVWEDEIVMELDGGDGFTTT